jgi:hypothetical protein
MRREVTAPALGLRALGVLLAGALAGCGLVDPDITDFELRIRPKQFTIDVEQWELSGVDQLVRTDCSQAPGLCAAAAETACAEGVCAGRCDGATDTCELQIFVGLWQAVNPGEENPELRNLTSEPIVEVTIDSIAYQVDDNTLTVATPELVVYVAPSTVMSPRDPEARMVGTIPPVPAGTEQSERDVEISAAGRQNLALHMGDYMTPFNLIVGADLTIGEGDPIPEGRLTATVRVRAHAGL